MRKRTAILSVIYYEPDWANGTCVDISQHAQGFPVFFVDRQGTGGLAEAINRGFRVHQLEEFEWVWVLTNIRFGPNCLTELLARMGSHAAVHPAFKSDHAHMRSTGKDETVSVPFVEFTAPLVRSEMLMKFPLIERMPYSGHDLDWGYRVRQAGHTMAVCHGVTVAHTYIRHNTQPHPVTKKRAQNRAALEAPTKALLEKIYGPQWFVKLRAYY